METAQERNESIFPALIYSSTVMYAFSMTFTGYVTAATMASGDGAAGETISSPARVQTQNQSNSVSSDTEEGGFTREWVETHGKSIILFVCFVCTFIFLLERSK